LENYMVELMDLVTNIGKWKSQNEGYQGNATISDRRTKDFTCRRWSSG